ncbi:cytochrome P450 76M5-like [Miscanthus floridulus]|uniref:cytochrome P450 76M5-like n=1 Tax=Miscanthus floridulus TaxID=154761 RepID=UPI00345A92AA
MRLKLGLTTAVVIFSRDAARDAFTRHDRGVSTCAVPDMARAAGFSERSMIWLPASDPRWKALRGVAAAHAFTPRSLAAARGVRERKVRDLVGYFRRRSGSGQEVVEDVGQAVYGGVLNLVSSALFSIDVVDDVGAESARGLRELVEEIVDAIARPNVSDLVAFLAPLDLQGWRRWTARPFRNVFRILDGIIDRRLSESDDDDASPAASSEGKHGGDFLDAFLELLSAGKIRRDNVTTIVFDVFAAGTDTIAITVEWAMAELLRNRSVMAKCCGCRFLRSCFCARALPPRRMLAPRTPPLRLVLRPPQILCRVAASRTSCTTTTLRMPWFLSPMTTPRPRRRCRCCCPYGSHPGCCQRHRPHRLPDQSGIPQIDNAHPMRTRGKAGVPQHVDRLNLHAVLMSPLPHSIRDAYSGPNWRSAMQAAFDALIANNTWCLVP